MSTEILLTAQVIIILVIALVILLLMLRRQKKTIDHLKTILTTVKDDISGENLSHHLQREIDDTTAHCGTSTIEIRADYKAEDMAISIRYAALQNELALLQAQAESAKTPWREKIKNYNKFATLLSESIQQRIEAARQLLESVHGEELALKNAALETQERQQQQLQEQLARLHPMSALIEEAAAEMEPMEAQEQKLYKALLALCENYENSGKLREVVFLVHEAFHEQDNAPTAMEAPAQKLNMQMMNTIIDNQNGTLRILREQIELLDKPSLRDEFLQGVDKLAASVEESKQWLENLSMSEDTSAEELTTQLEQQHRELQTLQQSFNELETRYLALYRETKQAGAS